MLTSPRPKYRSTSVKAVMMSEITNEYIRRPSENAGGADAADGVVDFEVVVGREKGDGGVERRWQWLVDLLMSGGGGGRRSWRSASIPVKR
ncbi:hypothetical protein L1987_80657 [Smallanthus sonchifolius]|uniref:Uncharacterized protein n=1 Tax=Smallanthus sonchifolius TaxID=185202 RepID=A0ACB8YNW5_9ASTR|nr:hypothetical protein L1987_80657 [Smallanthus sonchifolius]